MSAKAPCIAVLVASIAGGAVAGCAARDDGVVLLRRREPRRDGEPTMLAYARADDVTALRVRGLLADGFGAELLRTYAMARRFAGRGGGPALVAFGSEDTYRSVPFRERQFDAGWFTEVLPPSTPIAWIDDSDPTPLEAQLVSALAGAIVDTAIGSAPQLLREGYATFLTVVAAEWSAPAGLDARDELRAMPIFGDVRGGTVLRPRRCGLSGVGTACVLSDPVLIATILRRMASSEAGRRMAPAEVYRPFLAVAPPRDVHPALLLGAFRNFQAKLFAAWHDAAQAGRPPADVVDLLDAYAEAYPAERPEVTRVLVVSTHALAHGYEPAVVAEVGACLERLTAQVLFGARSLRDAVTTLSGLY
jgi:hypothetical protein